MLKPPEMPMRVREFSKAPRIAVRGAVSRSLLAERLRLLHPLARRKSATAGQAPIASAPDPNAYHDSAHQELFAHFRDTSNYIVMRKNGGLEPDGESTLYTALAAVALASGNYHQDAWEAANVNDQLKALLTTLRDQSWGNPDGLGREHPIRHPSVNHYDEAGALIRNDPLSKDSFSPIVAAAYYSYSCPHSSDDVRQLARELMRKWCDYLVLNQWRTHSNYVAGEFESVHKQEFDPASGQWRDTDDDKKVYKNLFSRKVSNEPKQARQVTYKGPETYFLFPHEIYALQNVASKLGIPTFQWDVWSSEFLVELKQAMTDLAAPYLASAIGRGLDYLLQRLGFAIPYSIQLGTADWNFGKVEGVFEIRIPAADRQGIVANFTEIVRDIIREGVRLNNLRDSQVPDLVGIAVDRVLDLLPNSLGRDKWRSVLVGGLQQVLPWLSNKGWIEVLTFIATLELLKRQADDKPDVVSYTLWAYAVECETRPEMEDVLKPVVQDFFGFLRNKDNPNGLWAWLAEDSGRVHEEMALFENNDPRTWSDFAFSSTKFDEWKDRGLANPSTASSDQFPRLDYLLLRALDEKGPPRGVSDVLSDWWQSFVDAVSDACQAFINAIKDRFERLGQYTRDALDAAGNIIRETWTTAFQYTQEQWKNGSLTLKRLWDRTGKLLEKLELQLDGKWLEEYWNRATEKYWRGLWDSPAGKQIELMRELADNTWEEIYFAGRDGFKYWRGLWTQRSGGAMLEWFRTYANDQWEEIYQLGRDGFKYWRGLWNQRTNGTMVEWFKKFANDQWEEIYFAGRGAEKYWRGLWDRVGTGATQLERFRTLASDQWEEVYLTGRDGFKYWRGLWTQRTAGTMTEWFRTHANDQWEEIYFAGRGAEKYWRGLWDQRSSTGKMLERFREETNKWTEEYWNRADPYWRGIWDRRGAGAKMLERYTKRLDNSVVVEVWNAANEYGQSIFDAAGNLLSRTGISGPSLPSWWPPSVHIPGL